jgi:lactoylglutathione lyase
MPSELIHTCYRITDIDRSVAFYVALGFEQRRQFTLKDGAVNTFMGFPGDDDRLELTWNPGVEAYEIGTGYGHIALAVPDAAAACAEIRGRGGKVVREAGPMKHGTTIIAFVEEPDGYKIELIQRA